MVHAFVMVKAEVGEVSSMADQIQSLEVVDEAHVVAGEYDIVAEVGASEVYEILQSIADEIQALSGILDTKTYVSMEE